MKIQVTSPLASVAQRASQCSSPKAGRDALICGDAALVPLLAGTCSLGGDGAVTAYTVISFGEDSTMLLILAVLVLPALGLLANGYREWLI